MGKNKVYIATSLDGYIADVNGGIEWLDMFSIPEGTDMGYAALMDSVDALVMGRVTFETVCAFDVPWPYTKPVCVLSHSMNSIPAEYTDKVILVKGNNLDEVLSKIHALGYHSLYVDGGRAIQSFLKEGLIDEITLTQFPILLGGGSKLFGDLVEEQKFELVSSEVFIGQLVQSTYRKD